MAFSLHAATVPSFMQILAAQRALLDKAAAYCTEKHLAPESVIQARLAEDMLPFAYQVKSSVVHSAGALDGVRKGVFSPDTSPPPASFPALKALVEEGLSRLERTAPAEVDAFVGRDMQFAFGEHRIAFTAENFLLSFSQPNFYFHAATAYDILRWRGVPIGKRDFLGQLRARR
jgi:uncharacterized protein